MPEIGLTDEDRERCADGIDARTANSDDSGKVSSEQCVEWRRRVRLHERYSDIADDEGVSITAVSTHVRGECSHEVDEPIPAYARESSR